MVFFFQWCTQMYVKLKRASHFWILFPKAHCISAHLQFMTTYKVCIGLCMITLLYTAVFLPHRADILRCVFSIAYLRMQKGNKKVYYYNTQYAVQTHKKLLQILIFWKTCFSCWIHECTLWINYLGNGQWLQFWYILKTGPTAS